MVGSCKRYSDTRLGGVNVDTRGQIYRAVTRTGALRRTDEAGTTPPGSDNLTKSSIPPVVAAKLEVRLWRRAQAQPRAAVVWVADTMTQSSRLTTAVPRVA
eukprot:1568028-Prymnesium_polylepis.1